MYNCIQSILSKQKINQNKAHDKLPQEGNTLLSSSSTWMSLQGIGSKSIMLMYTKLIAALLNKTKENCNDSNALC